MNIHHLLAGFKVTKSQKLHKTIYLFRIYQLGTKKKMDYIHKWVNDNTADLLHYCVLKKHQNK